METRKRTSLKVKSVVHQRKKCNKLNSGSDFTKADECNNNNNESLLYNGKQENLYDKSEQNISINGAKTEHQVVTSEKSAFSVSNQDLDLKSSNQNLVEETQNDSSLNNNLDNCEDSNTSMVNTSMLNEDCKITQSMIEEEENCKNDHVKEAQLSTLANRSLHQATQKQRYDRLQVLLDRSQLYATYLLNRINKRAEANLKRSEKNKTKESNNTANDSNEKDKKVKRKRKREEPENIENYIDKSELEERVKKQKLEVSIEKNHSEKNCPKRVDTFCRKINGQKVSDRQPKLLTGGVMREYQLDGMEWLQGLFENGINGILADEMGLGKTIQSIALILSLIEQNVIGPFIIAAPLSTLPNWMAEFNKFAPEINVVLYHGSIEERFQIRRKLMRVKRYSTGHASLPVVISSYEILMRDRQAFTNMRMEWKYLIVDEGHRIKNLNCKLIKELKEYRTANRLLLTGTPLQNNLSELWSLLNFILPDIFDDLTSFQSWFDFSAVTSVDENSEKLIAQEQEAKVLQTLHSILTPFLLRRLKTDIDLTIPPKKEVIVYAPLTPTQEAYYKTTLDRTIIDIIQKKNTVEEKVELTPSGRPKRKARTNVKYTEEDDSQEFDFEKLLEEIEESEKKKKELQVKASVQNNKSVVNIRLQNIMMQLRKCCNHPYLLEYPLDPKTQELVIDENIIKTSGKMLLLDKILPALKSNGHKVLIFSQMTQMMDILQDYCYLRGYGYCRIDGTMSVLDRQENIKKFTDEKELFIFLLSTRAGGLGLNLMMADTCIIYDSDWNPQVDLQAQDRCHRIGQTKPVVIYRFVTANTIDQKIIERAACKRKLEKMVIHEKNFKGGALASAISPRELLELLQSKDASCFDAGNVISDDDLNKLLDRSDMATVAGKRDQVKKNKEKKVDNNRKIFKVIENVFTDDIIF
ncbi:lymphoid-specific helicase isoform X3 [Hydra vulgaris]|uniref:Lymphoid-specific helicase isoform X3 n=1 Tax=Hydra vulgaris TaxID=6087 RepID=A0ABM4DEV9_HYDVU